MPATEQQLKEVLKNGMLSPLYFLYGDEPYLVSHYAAKIADKAVPPDDMAVFNRHVFDGDSLSMEELEAAVQALPMMGEHTCVWVRNYDPASANAAAADRMKSLLASAQEPCVLLFSVTAFSPDVKKNAKWKSFLSTVEKNGTAVFFSRRSPSDVARVLCRGAAKRSCTLSAAVAAKMTEQCGNDLELLLNELDKLCALCGEGGEITADMVETAAVRQLEASVYELSKALLAKRYDAAYDCIARLFAVSEEPIRILSVLSETYVDLYRVKVSLAAGYTAEKPAAFFSYRGREFRLRNAARDGRSLSLQALRDSLELLAQADTRMKSVSASRHRLILEETVAQLILIAKTA
ncbi:MAG: DNA polymerase III subunit delta [Acutalibacteraceae bacterium]